MGVGGGGGGLCYSGDEPAVGSSMGPQRLRHHPDRIGGAGEMIDCAGERGLTVQEREDRRCKRGKNSTVQEREWTVQEREKIGGCGKASVRSHMGQIRHFFRGVTAGSVLRIGWIIALGSASSPHGILGRHPQL